MYKNSSEIRGKKNKEVDSRAGARGTQQRLRKDPYSRKSTFCLPSTTWNSPDCGAMTLKPRARALTR